MEGVRSQPELRGIIPNSFAHVFGHIAKSVGDTRFLVGIIFSKGFLVLIYVILAAAILVVVIRSR